MQSKQFMVESVAATWQGAMLRRDETDAAERVSVINLRDVEGGRVRAESIDTTLISGDMGQMLERRNQFLRAGDLVVTIRGTRFDAAVLDDALFEEAGPFAASRVVASQHFAVVRCSNRDWADVIAAWITGADAQAYIRSNTKRGTMTVMIPLGVLRSLPLPSLSDEQLAAAAAARRAAIAFEVEAHAAAEIRHQMLGEALRSLQAGGVR